MRVIVNERAVYLIFEHDSAHIQHSADQLGMLAHGVESDDEMFRPLIRAVLDLEQKMKTPGAIPGNEREDVGCR